MRTTVVRALSTLVLFAALAAIPGLWTPRDAEAGCWYPFAIHEEYWSHYWGGGPACAEPCVIVGECHTDCNRTRTCWGTVTSDVVRTASPCPPVCV
jgi:hypothetical protein